MDTKNLSGLLFLLGTAALTMPGCDDDDTTDTGADTDGMTATTTASGTGSASDSDTTPSTASDTTPSTASDTTPSTDSDTTPSTDSDTTPTTTTTTDTDTGTDTDGTTITDTDGDTGTTGTTGIDTVGPNEVCTGYASVYEECYEGKDTYDYDMNVEFCETAITEGLAESPECGEAVETLFGCISGLSCKEFNSQKACVTENDAAIEACPNKKG